MSITIKDIAKLAGVSHATVSRVLNNHKRVDPDTRAKILALIKELNFSPSASARSLISGKSYTIALLVLFDLQQFPADFLPSILMGMTTELNCAGYNLTLYFDQIGGKKDQVPLGLLTSNKLDGVFILGVETQAELTYKVSMIDLPIVLVNQRIEELNLSYVVADDEGGAYMATSHLLDLGHEKIAFIAGNPKYQTSIDRREGYHRALSERGMVIDSSIEKIGNFDKDKGFLAMKELLNVRPDITAVFAANDLMAVGAIKAIKEKGLSVPRNIAVVGFDDSEFAEIVEPALTTIKKSRTLMGSEAAKVMLTLLKSEGMNDVKQIVLPTRLIIRESSKT